MIWNFNGKNRSIIKLGLLSWWFSSLCTRGPIPLGAWVQPSITNDPHLWSLLNGHLWRSPQHRLKIDPVEHIYNLFGSVDIKIPHFRFIRKIFNGCCFQLYTPNLPRIARDTWTFGSGDSTAFSFEKGLLKSIGIGWWCTKHVQPDFGKKWVYSLSTSSGHEQKSRVLFNRFSNAAIKICWMLSACYIGDKKAVYLQSKNSHTLTVKHAKINRASSR